MSKDEAVFVFLIPAQRQYECSDRGLLGIHVIRLRNLNQDYEFGFYVDNPLDGALGYIAGNLRELLSTPMGFYKAFKVGKETFEDLKGVTVDGFASDLLDKLTIRVRGQSVETLFSGRSKYCTFESRVRDGRHSKTSVRVPIV